MSQLKLHVSALSAAFALALPGVIASNAQAADPLQAPAGTTIQQLYAPDASKVAGAPGTVVWWQEIPSNDLASLNVPGQETPPPHRSFRLIYRSTAIDGTPNVESAAVYVPLGAGGTPQRPLGGWKVTAWDHATSGGADICAPSRVADKIDGPNGTKIDNPDYYMHEITGNEIISNLLAKNLVNVKVDYEGLGTPGKHPYLIAKSLGRSTIDAVKATRAFLAPNFGTASADWVVAGQSEGGIAALGTSSLASTLAPELRLKGTLAAVPPVNNKLMVFDLGIWTGLSALTPLGSLMLQGAAMDDASLGSHLTTGNPATDILSAAGAEKWKDIETKCLNTLGASTSLGGTSYSELFGPSAASYKPALYNKLDQNDPYNLTLGNEPIQIWAGGLDVVALQSEIFDAARHQKYDNGKDVTWRSSPFAMHPNIVDNFYSGHEMADWIGARLGS